MSRLSIRRRASGAASTEPSAVSMTCSGAPWGCCVNAPINRVVDRDNLFERIRRQEVHYADGPSTTNIEFAEARDDLVVIMGEEIAHPLEHTPHTGSTVHRRFTDIWRPQATTWELAIRQATITHIDPA